MLILPQHALRWGALLPQWRYYRWYVEWISIASPSGWCEAPSPHDQPKLPGSWEPSHSFSNCKYSPRNNTTTHCVRKWCCTYLSLIVNLRGILRGNGSRPRATQTYICIFCPSETVLGSTTTFSFKPLDVGRKIMLTHVWIGIPFTQVFTRTSTVWTAFEREINTWRA